VTFNEDFNEVMKSVREDAKLQALRVFEGLKASGELDK